MGLELPLDFKESLKLLNEKGDKYLLIGGYAVGQAWLDTAYGK
jgi:hypothetical protein